MWILSNQSKYVKDQSFLLCTSYFFLVYFLTSTATVITYMNIFSWMIFALINVILIFSMDYDPKNGSRLEGFILGITGALSGSVFAYIIVKGVTKEFVSTFFLVLLLESMLLGALFFFKSFKRIRI